MDKISLANLPTPIQKMDYCSLCYNKNMYIKRDDLTGLELSGNKIRKLEYVLADAIQSHHDTIITVGAIQSNHCRATAAACARLGLDCHLILTEKESYHHEGNYMLDYLLGAHVHLIPTAGDLFQEMEALKAKLHDQGRYPYLIPVGASNPIGSLGYREAYQEIIQQETALGITFDTIALAVGSGGTYAGLWYENKQVAEPKNIVGFSVSSSAEKFTQAIQDIVVGMDYQGQDFSSIQINDHYIGQGYSIAQESEIEFYVDIMQNEGILLDPCYSGKAFYGLVNEIKHGRLAEAENILFIHTGGVFGWTKEDKELASKIAYEKINNF
ncbi:D-cysteine desulfhydrase family protein [Facklamia sp. DSM 111018]|uniref:D-cysteine desulfhydrase family protein n=1 Tax=Facklamia lactis TaxID=2749967 RepID=A0ABS0LN60_9LACT|nr:D-cysteine desulfhydrase family protein [Facklamia lactis]MBG9979724.1 D-cysteine desulfhydrase family protein [Facklamia lactis]MBG9985596.1 D-cysteine desulfhydrase family protein [Facklamia lactis]